MPTWRLPRRLRSACLLAMLLSALPAATGCWAPLVSPGVEASSLPDSFRTPCRTAGAPLNLASLSIPPQTDYILGPNDVLEVVIHGLYPGGEIRPVRAQIMGNGDIQLPLVGPVHLGGLNLMQAHVAINAAYANGFVNDPRTNVYLIQKASVNVLVLGDVNAPGMYSLPKYENDVAHALAAAGGLMEDAAAQIEVHRRVPLEQVQAAAYNELQRAAPTATIEVLASPSASANVPAGPGGGDVRSLAASPALPPGSPAPMPGLGVPIMQEPLRIVKIPLRGYPSEPVYSSDIVLNPGDVVVVPSRKDEVFYVVGRLSPTNFVRFSIGKRERDIGAGFLLPRDREIDVVTAVAMAGYIDPIDSPTTVTVHRHCPDGRSLLIRVDLIKARYERRENVNIMPGDIVYLNPDTAWWARTQFDRIIVSLFTESYRKWLGFGR